MAIRATYLDQSSYNYIFSRCISSLESIQDSFFRCDNWYQNDMPQIIVNICNTRSFFFENSDLKWTLIRVFDDI